MKEVKFTSITDALCYAISRHFDTISYSFEEGKLSVRKDEVVEYCPWKCNPHVAFNGFGHLFPNTGLPVNKQPELYFDVNGLREHYIKFRLSFSSAKFVEVPKSLARYLLITTNDISDRILSTAIDSQNAFHIFSYILGHDRIDCKMLDNTIGYNYELKHIIDNLRTNLGQLESKSVDLDSLHTSIHNLKVQLNSLEKLMS